MDKLKNSAFNGLKWLERYTKTDMVYLAKGGFWLGIGQFVASGAAFLTSIAFSNLVTPETFGFYKYVLSIYSLLAITTLSGMDSAVTQAISRGFDGTFFAGVKEKIKWGIFGTVLSITISIYYYTQQNITLSISFLIISIFIPLIESLDMYNSLLWAKKLFSEQSIYGIIKKITSLILIIGTLFLTKNIFIIIGVYFISISIPNYFIYSRVKKTNVSNNNIDTEAIKYGKNLSTINIVRLVSAELDKILVFHYLGAINLAVYSLAIAPTDQIKGLLKNVNSLAFPKFAQRNSDEIKKVLNNKMLMLASITTGIVLVYIVLAPIFYRVFFPKYLESIVYSQVISLSLVGGVLIAFFYTILESQKAQKELYQYNLYESILGIIILFPLIYYFGIWGAIASRIINRIIFTMLGFVLVRRMNYTN